MLYICIEFHKGNNKTQYYNMDRKVMTSANKYNIVYAVPDIPPIDPPPGRWGQRRRNNLRYLKEIRKRGLIKEIVLKEILLPNGKIIRYDKIGKRKYPVKQFKYGKRKGG